jgi:hypothetical protein
MTLDNLSALQSEMLDNISLCNAVAHAAYQGPDCSHTVNA